MCGNFSIPFSHSFTKLYRHFCCYKMKKKLQNIIYNPLLSLVEMVTSESSHPNKCKHVECLYSALKILINIFDICDS